jgi:hypothetical protein
MIECMTTIDRNDITSTFLLCNTYIRKNNTTNDDDKSTIDTMMDVLSTYLLCNTYIRNKIRYDDDIDRRTGNYDRCITLPPKTLVFC